MVCKRFVCGNFDVFPYGKLSSLVSLPCRPTDQATYARAVFPQSGHIWPEYLFSQKCPDLSIKETHEMYEPLIEVQYTKLSPRNALPNTKKKYVILING